MGARYAELAGEAPAVCRAIEHHYDPRSAAGELPADRLSAVLSVADRLDNLAGCWRAGFVPTGAKDPYALRRHTLAVLEGDEVKIDYKEVDTSRWEPKPRVY